MQTIMYVQTHLHTYTLTHPISNTLHWRNSFMSKILVVMLSLNQEQELRNDAYMTGPTVARFPWNTIFTCTMTHTHNTQRNTYIHVMGIHTHTYMVTTWPLQSQFPHSNHSHDYSIQVAYSQVLYIGIHLTLCQPNTVIMWVIAVWDWDYKDYKRVLYKLTRSVCNDCILYKARSEHS